MAFERNSADGVAILLWATSPDEPARAVTPFLCASAAAAMDVPTEMYFAARSVHLLVPGVADKLWGSADAARHVYDVMREAASHGVRFYACSEALRAQGLTGRPLIAACEGHGGMVQFMARTADPAWRTLVF